MVTFETSTCLSKEVMVSTTIITELLTKAFMVDLRLGPWHLVTETVQTNGMSQLSHMLLTSRSLMLRLKATQLFQQVVILLRFVRKVRQVIARFTEVCRLKRDLVTHARIGAARHHTFMQTGLQRKGQIKV